MKEFFNHLQRPSDERNRMFAVLLLRTVGKFIPFKLYRYSDCSLLEWMIFNANHYAFTAHF